MLVNIERMRRDMDELLGEGWAAVPRQPPAAATSTRASTSTTASPPAEDRSRDRRPSSIADLAGVGADAVNIEVSGRMLVISGKRPVRRTEGRAYQQVEIPTGSFRRAVELGVDIDGRRRPRDLRGRAAAGSSCRSGLPESTARQVPIERSSD